MLCIVHTAMYSIEMAVQCAYVNQVRAQMDKNRYKMFSVFLLQIDNDVQEHIDALLIVEVSVAFVALAVCRLQ